MAFRIAHSAPQAYGKTTAPVKAKSYLNWLHELPCVVSGRFPVEAAHVNFANPALGATGRGKSRKASDRWALPLHPEMHAAQHHYGDERGWWRAKGVNPHLAALVLYGLWNERKGDATDQAIRLIRAGLGCPRKLFEETPNAN